MLAAFDQLSDSLSLKTPTPYRPDQSHHAISAGTLAHFLDLITLTPMDRWSVDLAFAVLTDVGHFHGIQLAPGSRYLSPYPELVDQAIASVGLDLRSSR